MVWCGVVWYGVVWCGVVWCGVVWCGVIWCGVVWCGVVWRSAVQCGLKCITEYRYVSKRPFMYTSTHVSADQYSKLKY